MLRLGNIRLSKHEAAKGVAFRRIAVLCYSLNNTRFLKRF